METVELRGAGGKKRKKNRTSVMAAVTPRFLHCSPGED